MQVAATYSFDRPSASIHANAKDEKRSAGSAQSPTEKLAVEGAQSPTLTVLKATMVEPAPEAEIPTISTGGTRAQLSKVEKHAVEGARSPPYTVLETGGELAVADREVGAEAAEVVPGVPAVARDGQGRPHLCGVHAVDVQRWV